MSSYNLRSVIDAPVAWRPTPLAALELRETPTHLHFVRDHFAPPVPERPWSLTLAGGARALVLDFDTLCRLPQRSLTVLLECAGHRRTEFSPVPDGIPWASGAVGQARWTGVSLRTVLDLVGIPRQAREVVLEGADAGPVAGRAGIHHFARSLPLAKALDGDVLLATAVNGHAITADRGGPVRAIVPGWYATDSVKWLVRIWFAEEFTGFFEVDDYRFHAPGEIGAGRRLTELAINALITAPSGGSAAPAAAQTVRGIAWGGAGGVAEVLVRVDLGPWTPARLHPRVDPYAGVGWELAVRLPPGPHEIACRAVDRAGHAQPVRPVDNLRGYANNAVHRVRVLRS